MSATTTSRPPVHFLVIALVIGVIVVIGLLAKRLDVQSWPLVRIGLLASERAYRKVLYRGA
jgi:hypothetical protein